MADQRANKPGSIGMRRVVEPNVRGYPGRAFGQHILHRRAFAIRDG